MDLEKLTPMMKQYMEVKNKYKDTILFYRLGDFYEMFFDDALTASKVLEIALTGRNAGLEERVPMCGVPFHSSESYIKKLIDNGFKVAICEQLETPSAATKLVKRDVIKIITPGTDLNPETNDYNYIMSITDEGISYSLSLCDISTGKLKAITCDKNIAKLYDQIKTYQIKELVVNDNFDTSIFNELLKSYKLLISITKVNENIQSPILNNIEPSYTNTFKQLFSYIESMQMEQINYYLEVEYDDNTNMYLDFASKFSLELTQTIKNNEKYGTLFWYLDKTKTAMGSRLLKEYIQSPLANQQEIINRQQFVEEFVNNFITTEMIGQNLKNVYDIARIASKVALETVTPKELLWLANSLAQATLIKTDLQSLNSPIINDFLTDYDDLANISTLIKDTISETILDSDKRNNDFIIKDGVNKTLDEYREVLNESTNWLLDFTHRQQELTGIKNLKVMHNKVFGYYIEVLNSSKHLIKDEYGYTRKQTLTNSERYINEELKNQETLIVSATENVSTLQQELYNQFKKQMSTYTSQLQYLSKKLAYIDVMYSYYKISSQYGFSKPTFNQDNTLEIKESFHPIIKEIDKDKNFINNDFNLDKDTDIILITGPNMGGKSTYMRQLAIIVIMAQIGCFVPAESAHLPLFDRIFTRIGSNDDVLEGQSTFMVEMSEASNAINNSTDQSLILFDELGRGTATYDGMSLAYAMIEYLANKSKAKVLFSTHYHELTSLANEYSTIKNYHAGVVEDNDNITFTYKVKPGQIDKSYGIHVAQLANLPQSIINRSYELLNSFEQDNDKEISISKVDYDNLKQPDDKQYQEIKNKILSININNITPIQALTLIQQLQEEVTNNE